MTDKEKNSWIKFVPSLDLPKERVSIAYDTHDERGIRYAYGYFQFYNGTCGCFGKDGNEQPKVVKAEDIKYWMPVPSLDVQEECNITGIKSKEATGKLKECIDNITDESLAKARKQLQEELVNGGLDLGCGVIWKDEKSASGDLEKVVEEIVDPTVLNAYGVKEIANRLRRTIIESVSEEQVKESLISKHEDKTCKENGNSLTQEPASEDLKEAYERYVDERMVLLRPDIADMSCDRDTKMSFDIFDGSEVEVAFYEGAKWQKAKDQETIETAIHHAYHNGKLEMKEQMMAKAVDGFVIEDTEEGNGNFLLSAEYLSKDMGLKDRQKVKVIVVCGIDKEIEL